MTDPGPPKRSPLTDLDRRPDPMRDPEVPEPDTDPSPDPGPGARFRLNRRQLVGGGAAFVLLALLGWSNCGVRGCPDVRVLEAYQYGGGPLVLDRDGKPLTHLNPLARKTVALSTLPSYLPEAFIAVEDRRFRDHGGVDWRRVPGAVLANVRSRGFAQGFSTITMQLARNVFPERLPGSERTLRRKLAEIRVAGEIEDRFTKDEILELYLNHIYFGEGAYGVETAARHYFGRPASELTLAQAATLAAIPKAPTLYDPRRQPERALARRDLVLRLMAEQGRIDTTDAGQARGGKLTVLEKPPRDRGPDGLASYFLAEIQGELEDRYGSELYYGGMRVQTTLDRTMQQALEEELEKQIRAVERGSFGTFRHPAYDPAKRPGERTPYLQGAGVVLDARTGDVLALVGGRDHDQSSFDRAVLGHRQMGSAFKPFVYATAIQNGWTTVDHLDDEPFRIVRAGSPAYEPHNFDGRFSGSVTLREALVRSLNVPTVRLATEVGLGPVAELARNVGFTGEISETPAMALGTASTSPLELALAYVPFATLGNSVERPRMIQRILDEDGDEVWSQEPSVAQVMDPAVAYIVTDMLTDVIDRGTGTGVRRAGYSGVAAGKTGTTTDGKDVWFVGYTPELVGVIWMGLDQPATGTVLMDGCRVAGAREEVFLTTRVPPAGCPVVEPPHRGFLDRTLGWFGSIFGKGRRGDDREKAPEASRGNRSPRYEEGKNGGRGRLRFPKN